MRLIVLLLLMLAPGGAMPACAVAPVAAPMMHHAAMEMTHRAPAPDADHCRADVCLGCAIEMAPAAALPARRPIAMLPALATAPVRLRGIAPPIVSPPPRLG